MADSNPKEKRRKINTFNIVILVAVSIGLIAFGVINRSSVSTVAITSATVEDKIVGEGLVSFSEALIYANTVGEPLYVYPDGRRILLNKKLATIYQGELDENTKAKLRAINDDLIFLETKQQYNKEVFSDTSTLKKEITKSANEIAIATKNNDYSKVYELKGNIESYNEQILEKQGQKPKTKTAADVQGEIANIEKSMNVSKKDYYSPVSGMFSSKIDGFEEILTPVAAMSLTPEKYNEISKIKPKTIRTIEPNKPFCKVINNYEWYITTKIKKEIMGSLNVGSIVSIRVNSKSSQKVSGVVESISAEQNGEYVLTIKSTDYIEDIFSTRNVEFELIKKTYKGLRIPQSALVEVNGKTGVFAIRDGVTKFMEVEVLFKEKNYAILKDSSNILNSEKNSLILYDLIVTNPNGVNEGQII